MKPTFIGIGAQKCASTWIYRILQDHPEVGVPGTKEIDFFSFHFDHGYGWYEGHFAGFESKRAVGEISPSYFCEAGVAGRAYRYAPEAKIIVSLRDPVVRALSNHRHEVRVGHVAGPDLSFRAALANNPMYVDQGLYATHLKRWLSYFPSDQILVVLMEDIERSPRAIAEQVYAFLGVNPDHLPASLQERSNRSYANRYRMLARLKDAVYARLSRPGLGWVWSLSTGLGLRSLYRRINVVPSEQWIPPPDESTMAELRERFAPEIRELSGLIRRPLDDWLKT